MSWIVQRIASKLSIARVKTARSWWPQIEKLPGAGFIGLNLTYLLITKDSTSSWWTCLEVNPLEVDFNELLAEPIPEVIFHLAAQIEVRESARAPIHDGDPTGSSLCQRLDSSTKPGEE